MTIYPATRPLIDVHIRGILIIENCTVDYMAGYRNFRIHIIDGNVDH